MTTIWMGNDETGYDVKKAAMVFLERKGFWVVNEGIDNRLPAGCQTAAQKVMNAIAHENCLCGFWFGSFPPFAGCSPCSTKKEAVKIRAGGSRLLWVPANAPGLSGRLFDIVLEFCETKPRQAPATPLPPPRQPFATASNAPLLLSDTLRNAHSSAPVQVLLDTDMLTDCDDVAALALLLQLERIGLARILGITVSSGYPASAAVVDAIDTFYGRGDIPIGAPKDGSGFRRDDSCFLDKISAEFPHALAGNDDAQNAVHLLRKALSDAPPKSVKLVTIGYLCNVAALLRSSPDSLSPLSGMELVREKVSELVCMTGNFPDDPAVDNVNFTRSPQTALFTIRNYPGRITFVGRDIGHNVFVGDRFHELPFSHPLRRAYELHRGRYGTDWDHHTADPSTILYAVCGLTPWYALQSGSMLLNDDCSFSWDPTMESNKSYLLQVADRHETARVIDALIRLGKDALPQRRQY
ncbi:MAG: nucleoside hydrolase [Kiritimatiellia bacterium]